MLHLGNIYQTVTLRDDMDSYDTAVESATKGGRTYKGEILYYAFHKHIANLVGAADLEFILPPGDFPIIGGRAPNDNLEGILVIALDNEKGANIDDKEINKLISTGAKFIEESINGTNFDSVSDRMNALRSQFNRSLSGGGHEGRVRCVIITPGIVNDRMKWVNDDRIATEVIDIQSFNLEGEIVSDTISVKMHDLGPPARVHVVSSNSANLSLYMGGISGETLAQLFRKVGRRLLESNVRDFLGEKGINKGMRLTIDENPQYFGAFNNGITIVCRDVELSEDGEVKKLVSPSIVNGGQTTVVIAKAHMEGADLSQIEVPLKVVKIAIKPEKAASMFEKRISKFANSQNNIKATDQMVNEEPHPMLSELSFDERFSGWSYLHRRGMLATRELDDSENFKEWEAAHPADKQLEATTAAIIWNAWWGEPHIAARGAQKSFQIYHAQLRIMYIRKGWNAELHLKRSFGLYMIYKYVENIVNQRYSGYGSATRPHVIGWFAKLVERKLDLAHVWSTEGTGLSKNITQILDHLAKRVDNILRTYEEDDSKEWAKKEDCKNKIFSLQIEESILQLITTIPRTLDSPLEMESLNDFLYTIGGDKLWDSFNFTKDEVFGGSTFGLGSSFFTAMKFFKRRNLNASGASVLLSVWDIARSHGYYEKYPGKNDLYKPR